MKVEWGIEETLYNAKLVCQKYRYRARPSFNPEYELQRCEAGHRHVLLNGSDQDIVDTKKYNKFYPVNMEVNHGTDHKL